MLRLLLAHILSDFVAQPRVLVSMKRRGWRGIIIHSAIVTAFTAALAWGQFPHWWVWTLLLGLSHAFIEHFRTFYVKDGNRGGLYYFLLDQAAHLGVIVFIAAVSINWRPAELASIGFYIQWYSLCRESAHRLPDCLDISGLERAYLRSRNGCDPDWRQ
jgi:hypothetical protein